MNDGKTIMLRQFLEINGIDYNVEVAKQSLTGMMSKEILPIVSYPNTLHKFKSLMSYLTENSFSYEVIGALTNTYLAEGFRRDILIKTTKMKGVKYGENEAVIAECGCNLTKLSREFSAQAIAGYEGLVGIPGTVGGAVVNNSGGFGSSMDKVVKRVLVLENGMECWINNNEMGYDTRSSALKRGERHAVVLAVELDISHKRLQYEIDKNLENFAKFRKRWIDGTRKSLGSVFCADSLSELVRRNRVKFTARRLLSAFLRIFIKHPRLNVWLDFFFLGDASMAKHCDSLNRFCWDADTTEKEFYEYISFMQSKADNKLKLEIQIKR